MAKESSRLRQQIRGIVAEILIAKTSHHPPPLWPSAVT